jgi:hypothetical protein
MSLSLFNRFALEGYRVIKIVKIRIFIFIMFIQLRLAAWHSSR